MKFVEGTKSFAGHRRLHASRRRWTRSGRPPRSSTKPFIYLSAGVSNAEFTETLELAAEAGTRFSGVLCGRATWKDGIPIYGKQGADAFRKWLETEGVEEHRERQRAPQARAPVVRVLRRQERRRARRVGGRFANCQASCVSSADGSRAATYFLLRISTPDTLPAQVSPE